MEDPLREGEVALNLGCGRVYWPGWINVDSDRGDVQCDLRKLTFSDAYADRITAIHVFEHFYFWETQPLLAEWKRVLKPGGKLVLELPSMDAVFSHIAHRMKKGEAPNPTFSWLPIWGDPRHKDPAMCHRWGYFKADMLKVLNEAGFVDVAHEEPRYHFPMRDMRVVATKPQGDSHAI